MNKWLRGLLTGAGIGVLGAALVVTPLGFKFEKNLGLRWLFGMRGPIEPPAEVAVVAIDSSTGKALDLPKLPREWSRTVHARLIESLVRQGASVIVFDFDFGKPKSEIEDQAFAKAIADANRVVLYQPLSGRNQPIYGTNGQLKGSVWIEETVPPAPPLAASAKGLGPFPLPKIEQAASQFWTFKSSAREAPTTVALALQLHALDIYDRWLDVVGQAGAPDLEALPRAADRLDGTDDVSGVMRMLYSIFKKDPRLAEKINAIIENTADLDSREKRLMSALTGLYGKPESRFINFYGPPGTITTIPYWALIRPTAQGGVAGPVDLANKVVFVGYSDLFNPDQPDRFYTVFTGEDGIDLSGVEIMATAYANLLTNRTLRSIDPVATLLIILFFGFAVGCVVYVLPATVGGPVAIALTGIYGAGAQYAFNEAVLWLPLATPALVQFPLALLIGLMGQYLIERIRERRMSRAISYYLPENIVKDLTERSVDPSSVNKVVYGTCLATDMSGFTTISETKLPEELATFMNAYFEALAQPLKRHAVDVTEFHADTIMCAWTDTEPTPAARRNAILAAIDTVAAIRDFGQQHGGLKLNARIGLQDGHFYLGHTGGGGRFTFSILGDPANSAARLESLNRHLGTCILAAQSVVQDVEDLVVRPLGSFRLVGKAEAVPIVEIVGTQDGVETRQADLCARFSDALAVFAARQWAKAEEAFGALLDRYPGDGPSSFYLAASRRYAKDGAPAEDPTVIRMAEK